MGEQDSGGRRLPGTISGAPSVFVKGGTTRTIHDKTVAREFREAEERRDEADREREIARKPISDGGGVIHETKFAANDEQSLPDGTVLLDFVNSRGEPEYEAGMPLQCIGDIVMPDKPAYPGELMLLIICPKCKEKLPADHCIIQIRQSNRHWSLDARKAGEPFMWAMEPEVIYRSAGVVMDSEKFSCPRCNWMAVIDNNKIRTLRT